MAAMAMTTHLSDVLQRTGMLSEDQLEQVLASVQDGEGSIIEVVVRDGFAKEDAFLEAFAGALKLPFLELGSQEIEEEVLVQYLRIPSRGPVLHWEAPDGLGEIPFAVEEDSGPVGQPVHELVIPVTCDQSSIHFAV